MLEKCSVLSGCRPIKITQSTGLADTHKWKTWNAKVEGQGDTSGIEGWGETVDVALSNLFQQLISYWVKTHHDAIVKLDGEIDSRQKKAAEESHQYEEFCKRWGLTAHKAYIREYKK